MPVKIATGATLAELKALASTVSGTPAAHIALVKGDSVLGFYDEATLDSLELVDGDKIAVADFQTAEGEVKVKTLTGKVFQIHFAATDKVLTLKERVQDKQGIPVDQQRLVIKGRSMENDRTCVDYQLVPGIALHLILRLAAST